MRTFSLRAEHNPALSVVRKHAWLRVEALTDEIPETDYECNEWKGPDLMDNID